MAAARMEQCLRTTATTPWYGGLVPHSIVGDVTPTKTDAAECHDAPSLFCVAAGPFEVQQQARMGRAGGFGPEFSFMSQPALLDDTSTGQVEAICQRNKLGDDICQLFVAKALNPLGCLFEINDDHLKDMNHSYAFAYIADIRLAVKKMLSETDSTVRVITSKEENETSVDGEKGDLGGDGDHQGFCMGGTGGAGGVQTALGTEGAGGEDREKGSLDEAPQTPALYVALFTKLFARNLGGRGEMGPDGCAGKDGESPDFACLLFSFHGEPRRPLLFTTLLPSHIPTNIRQLLQDEGFHSVGGLLEAYDTDMRFESFESGQIRGVTEALSKFATRREILVEFTN
ncbi:hypothetical protein C8J57DRAFT_1479617 [Mycena rebaudengoi]|nr:hypothetical protein C8J57DRAFT_1479617 [Mycena rebaudengoi]